MANTLKFGNGEWAIKEGSALAYNDENSNFKPLPFDFARASTATYVAKDGLIKTAASGVPRIDFKDDAKGALLLEPQRTNLVTYSSELDNAAWTKSGTTITANNTTSPDGTTNADKIIASSGLSTKIAYQVISSTNSVAHTVSVFYKADEYSYAFLRVGGQSLSPYVIYNLLNQSVVSTANATSTKIEDYGSGWYRVSMTYTANSATNAPNIVFLPTSGYTLDSLNQPSYNGDGSSGGYIYGAMLEVGSYPTSYIPTQGSTVTRVVDSCLQLGFQDKNIFGSTQGSAVFELKWDIGGYVFDFSDALAIRLRIFDDGSTWKIRDYSGSSWVFTGFSKSNNVKTKIAFKWNGTQFTSFQDGVKSSSIDSFASSMAISRITTNILNNTSLMQFYNTALTDQELQALTQV